MHSVFKTLFWSDKFSVPSAAALSVLLFTPAPLPAALLAYEGFDYPVGSSIVGQTGGLNFANAWQLNSSGADSIYTNATASLGYTDALGSVLVTTGNHGYFAGSFTANNTAQPNRDFNFTRSSGTTWISFIGVREGIPTNTLPANPYPRGANLAFFNVTSERIAVGNASGAATNAWSILPANTASQLRQSATAFTEPVFVVLRIDHLGDTAAADNAYLFLNPILGVEPPLTAAATNVLGFADHTFNRIRPFAGGYNAGAGQPNAQFRLDEIRIGETYADVTPIVPVADVPPGLTVDMTNQVAELCASATFFVNATGSPPLHYQWFFNDTPTGGNSNSLALVNLAPGAAGNCFVIVTNAAGAVTSAVVSLTLQDTTAPVIIQCAGNQSLDSDGVTNVPLPDLTPQVNATDCSGIAIITQNPTAGTLVGAGTHPVTLSVTDHSNNVAQCQTIVTVNNTNVNIVYPGSPEIAKDGAAVLLVNYAAAPYSSRTLSSYPPAMNFAGQLSRVNFLRPEPTTAPGFGSRYFVCDLNRNVYIVPKTNPLDTNTWITYINFEEVFPRFDNDPGFAGGLTTFAFDPEYATNGIFYTVHMETTASTLGPTNGGLPGLDLTGYTTTTAINPPSGSVGRIAVLVEWRDTNVANTTFEGTAREILRAGFLGTIHPLGDLLFNPLAQPGDEDYRNLYLAMGDGRAGEAPGTTHPHPQRLDALVGKILRITPDINLRPGDELGGNNRYRIPTTGANPNPFVTSTLPGVRKEIYAYGFRNPHRMSWDPVSDKLFVNDIGFHAYEEVNLIQRGGNYGYARREGVEEVFITSMGVNGLTGSQRVPPVPFPNPDLLTVTNGAGGATTNVPPRYPVACYSHRDGDAISSGFVYRGSLMPQLHGKYIFGDITTARLFYCDLEELLAADDGDRATRAVIREIQVVFDSPHDIPDQGLTNRRLFDIVAEEYRARGGTSGGTLPGAADATNGSDPDGVPYGGGRADIRLAVGDDHELYVISKSDGMIRKMTASLHPPNIQTVTNAGGEVTLVWSAVPGWKYRVQYRTTLEDSEWSDLPGEVTATTLTASTSTPLTSEDRFFRVRLVLP